MGSIILIVASLILPAVSHEDLAANAFAKCCNSIQRISSLQCHVEYTEYQGKSDSVVLNNSATYCRVANTFRIIENCNMYIGGAVQKTVLDVHCDGNRIKSLSKTGATVSGGIHSPEKPNGAKCDAYNQCLFRILLPRYSTYRQAQEFFNNLKINGAGRLRDKNDKDVIEVLAECTIDDLYCEYTIQFDDVKGYITSIMIECRLKDQRKVTHQLKVVGVTEVAPGIHVPSSITRETYLEGDLLWRAQVVLSNIVVNDPVQPNKLNFKFPHGLEIYDSIRSTKYKVDENGDRISPEIPVEGGQALPNRNAK